MDWSGRSVGGGSIGCDYFAEAILATTATKVDWIAAWLGNAQSKPSYLGKLRKAKPSSHASKVVGSSPVGGFSASRISTELRTDGAAEQPKERLPSCGGVVPAIPNLKS